MVSPLLRLGLVFIIESDCLFLRFKRTVVFIVFLTNFFIFIFVIYCAILYSLLNAALFIVAIPIAILQYPFYDLGLE